MVNLSFDQGYLGDIDLVSAALKSLDSGLRDCVTIAFSSFRERVARHGIQYYQTVIDTGFRRYDDLDVDFWHYDTVSAPE